MKLAWGDRYFEGTTFKYAIVIGFVDKFKPALATTLLLRDP